MEEINHIKAISAAVDNIAEYGVGFDDAISTIAIPLLIALFAFSFPFLFSVITHINSKYASEAITQLFSKGREYKAFLCMSVCSVMLLIAVGLISLFLTGVMRHVFMAVANYLLIIAAAVYSCTILLFVKACVGYNTPNNIPELIELQYKQDLKKAESKLEKLEKKKEKVSNIRADSKRSILLMGLKLGMNYSKYDARQLRVNRYAELCNYAISKRNNTLFTTILLRVAEIAKEEKKLPEDDIHYHVNTFFTGIVNKGGLNGYDIKVEERLLSYWFRSFSRNHLPWMRAIVDMISSVIMAAKAGHTGLLDFYIQGAANSFGFIHRVPQVAFVRGDGLKVQKSLEQDVKLAWKSLLEMHYFAAAFIFSMRHFHSVKIMLMESSHWFDCLYPNTPAECLIWYAECKKHQDEAGAFNSWYSGLIAGNLAEPDLLERYTAFRLLTTNEERIPINFGIGDRELKIIQEKKQELLRASKLLKRDNQIVSFFPVIENASFDKVLYNCLQNLEDNANLQNTKEQGGWLNVIMDWFVCPCKRAQEQYTIYEALVSEEAKANITTMFGNILHGNMGAITDGIAGENDDTKTCVLNFGSYCYRVPKRFLFNTGRIGNHGLFNDIIQVFRARYYYLMLDSIKIMGIEEVKISPDCFEDFFRNLTGSNGEDYAIISINSAMYSFMRFDRNREGDILFKQTYQKADVHQIDIDSSWYLRDLIEVDEYRQALLIMKKKDLPIIEPVHRGKRCEVDFEDISDSRNGVAEVRMNIDSNLRLCYDRHAKVIKVITEKIIL